MTAEGDDPRTVGVVGAVDEVGIDDTLAAAGADVVTQATPPETTPDVFVAVGESALLSLARERPKAPILPVGAGPGLRSVPVERIEDAVTRLLAGEWDCERHPLVRVQTPGGFDALAVLDAMVVTAEPAHISEYELTADDEHVARFRADGVVVATPAGTGGYARAAGAPTVPPESGVFAIVPVAGFATTLDHWVVPATEVTVTVLRDDAEVEVMADDRTVGTAALERPIGISADGVIRTVRLPESVSPFERGDGQLEKL